MVIGGTPVHKLNENQLARWRGKTIGVVFQFFQLLPTLTVIENVMLPMDFCNVYHAATSGPSAAMHLLEQVEMADQADKLPSALSGGQQQRVAIARALANDPPSSPPTSPPATSTYDRRSRLQALRAPGRRRQDHPHGHPRRGPGPAGHSHGHHLRRPDCQRHVERFGGMEKGEGYPK